METALDPVCGMDVDKSQPAATSEYRGTTYYFCSRGCKVAFDKDPEKYLNPTQHMEHEHHGHSEDR